MDNQPEKLILPSFTDEELQSNRAGFLTPNQVIELRNLLKYSISLKFSSVFPRYIVIGVVIGIVLSFIGRNSTTGVNELIMSIFTNSAICCVVGYMAFRTWLEFDAGPLLVREKIKKDLLEQQVKVIDGYYIAPLSYPIRSNKNIYYVTIGDAVLKSGQPIRATSIYIFKDVYSNLNNFLLSLPTTQKIRCYYAANSNVLQSIELVNEN